MKRELSIPPETAGSFDLLSQVILGVEVKLALDMKALFCSDGLG